VAFSPRVQERRWYVTLLGRPATTFDKWLCDHIDGVREAAG
jgi:hypothetical protein